VSQYGFHFPLWKLHGTFASITKTKNIFSNTFLPTFPTTFPTTFSTTFLTLFHQFSNKSVTCGVRRKSARRTGASCIEERKAASFIFEVGRVQYTVLKNIRRMFGPSGHESLHMALCLLLTNGICTYSALPHTSKHVPTHAMREARSACNIRGSYGWNLGVNSGGALHAISIVTVKV